MTPGTPLIDALVATGLCDSKSAARRAIKEGGAYVNNVRADDPEALLDTDALHDRWVLLRRGKRTIAVADLAPQTPVEMG
ncbi:MAG: S4 domain-containing protein [Candidatus Nanopelagicales bacterium]